VEIDPAALAYYRCERLVQDIAEFCKQILAPTGGDEDRRLALRWLISNFEPGGVFEIAMGSCPHLNY
jgi:spectinomycin phosphotransferase